MQRGRDVQCLRESWPPSEPVIEEVLDSDCSAELETSLSLIDLYDGRTAKTFFDSVYFAIIKLWNTARADHQHQSTCC